MRILLLGLALAAALLQVSCGDWPPPGTDAGPQVPPELACASLVNATCGASLECGFELACEAARLLAEQDPVGTRCLQALGDAERYPACTADIRGELDATADDCTVLVDEVCGAVDAQGERACAQDPACVNAALLANPSTHVLDGGELVVDEQRLVRCAAAINEKALYPPCRP